jgi:hypothetical protein
MTAHAPAPILAEVATYSELLAALRQRAISLDLAWSSEDLHKVSGGRDSYIPAMLAECGGGFSPARPLGYETLGPTLAVLAARLALVEDESDAARRIQSRLPKMKTASSRAAAGTRRMTSEYMSEIGRLGGIKTAQVMRDIKRKRAMACERQRQRRARMRAEYEAAGSV